MSSSSVTQATFLSFRAISAISPNSKGVLFAKSVIFIIIFHALSADPYRFSNATRVFSTSFPDAIPIQAIEMAKVPTATVAYFRLETIAWLEIQNDFEVFPMDEDIPSPAFAISFWVVFPCSPISSMPSRMFCSSFVALSIASSMNCTFWLIGRVVIASYFSRTFLSEERGRGIYNLLLIGRLCSMHTVCSSSGICRYR